MHATTAPGGALDRQARLTVAAIATALFLSSFSQTVVSTALPRIIGEFGGVNMYSWVLSASMLASTVAIAPAGKLSDRFGRRPFLIGGIALFVASSSLTGFSRNMEELIAFRALQGLAGGVIAAASFAAIGDLFAPAERGRYMGLFTGIYAISSVAGPIVGGFVTDHLGWRWLFFANLPVGIVAVAVIWRWLPKRPRARDPRPIDVTGIAFLVTAVLALLFALTMGGNEFAWRSWQIASLFATAAVAIVALLLVERGAADPVLPLPALANRTYLVVAAVSFLTGMGLFGALAYMPLFIQGVLGTSATNSGVVNTPLMMMLTVGSVVAGNLSARSRRYRIIVLVGGALLTGGMALMITLDQHSAVAMPLLGMGIVGFGLGLSMPLLGLAVQNALPDSQLGVSSAATQFFRQVGGTLGIALSGSLLNSYVHGHLAGRLPAAITGAAPPEMIASLESPSLLLSPSAMDKMSAAFGAFGPDGPALFDATVTAMRGVLADGLHEVFLIGFIVSLVSVVVSVLLPNTGLASATERRGRGADPSNPSGDESAPGAALPAPAHRQAGRTRS